MFSGGAAPAKGFQPESVEVLERDLKREVNPWSEGKEGRGGRYGTIQATRAWRISGEHMLLDGWQRPLSKISLDYSRVYFIVNDVLNDGTGLTERLLSDWNAWILGSVGLNDRSMKAHGRHWR